MRDFITDKLPSLSTDELLDVYTYAVHVLVPSDTSLLRDDEISTLREKIIPVYMFNFMHTSSTSLTTGVFVECNCVSFRVKY